ncbi:hypothetical protein O3S80_10925 [Streptomyces sp. Lzd4kr]|nr:hypothetical protein [Streptomyces sp. Lzd4kr]
MSVFIQQLPALIGVLIGALGLKKSVTLTYQVAARFGNDPHPHKALLERQRGTRDGYCTAVRNDLALPPGHSAQWVPPMLGGGSQR